jgi:hypothetical protein
MAKLIINPITGQLDATYNKASEIKYDNTSSGLTATQVNDAIDEVQDNVEAIPIFSIASINSNVALNNHTINLVDTSAARTLTLPAPSVGAHIVIKDSSGLADTNAITVNPNGAETIDGAASLAISSNYSSTSLISNGTHWFII